MTKEKKNLIALGVVLLGGWLYLVYDDSKDATRKEEKRQTNALKAEKRRATADRNKSLINLLKVSSPLLTPVVKVAVDEFKTYRSKKI